MDFKYQRILLCTWILAAPLALCAQEARWRELSDQVAQLYQQGKYADAIPKAREALRLAEAIFGPKNVNVAALLNNLAELDRLEGEYAEAESLYKRALAINQETLGPEHPTVAANLANLAELYRLQEKYREAEPLYQQALTIEVKALGPDNPAVATELNNLALLYKQGGKYAEAEPLYEQALAINESALGKEHPSVAATLENLGNLYRAQGKYGEAELRYKRALDINEKALGAEHWKVAADLETLAELYRLQGRFGEAEPIYKRALLIDERALGPEHLKVAGALNNLAMLYSQAGRYAEAEPLFKRALAIDEKALGPERSDVITHLNNLAGLYRAQRRSAEAETLYRQALVIDEKALGLEHPGVATDLNNLAGFYDAEGRYGDAEPLLRRAVKILERASGPERPGIANLLNNLAGLYEKQGNYAEAEPLLKRALTITEEFFGPEHRNVVASLQRLAVLYQGQGKYAEAEPLYKRALAIDEKASGAEHEVVAADLNKLALLYYQEGKYAEAEPLHKRALAIDEKALGPDDPRVAAHLENLASLYVQEGKYAEAEPLHKRALAIDEKALGPNDPSVATDLNNLALLDRAEGRDDEAERLYKRVVAMDQNTATLKHPEDVAASLDNLAELYRDQGRYAEAENLYKQALALIEKTAGPDNPHTAPAVANLALLEWNRQNPSGADAYFGQSHSLYSKLFEQQFAYMSEKERLGYLATIRFNFPIYFSFVYSYREQHPELIGKLYNLLLWEKGMVAISVAAQRARLVASGDPDAIALLDQLTSKKSQLAALERAQRTDLMQSRSNVDQLRQEADDIEKELTKRSSTVAEVKKLAHPSWQQVRDALKKDEAAIEFLRFPFYNGKKWSSKSEYVALVLAGGAVGPTLVVLGEAAGSAGEASLEGAPMDDYRQRVLMKGESSSDFGVGFYQAFWKPLESKLTGVKRVYISPDGVLNQVSWAAIPTDDGRLLTEKYDVHVVLSTKDLLWARQGASNSSAVLIGNPQFDLSEAEYRAAVAALQTNAGSESSCTGLDKQTLSSEKGPEKDSKNVVSHGTATSDSTFEQGTRLEPLTETQKEMKSLSDLFKKNGWRVENYCRQNALEEAIKRVKSPRVLHLATHGFFKPDQRWAKLEGTVDQFSGLEDPMLRSGLYFAGADRTLAGDAPIEGVENGVLTAYEATGLNLQGTELVVLSACETGLGRVENGEGVFGLRRALQEAGAEAVLMSMWPVPDRETEELMTLFYEKWLSGMDKHQALHEAQMELRKELQVRWQVDQPPPHFWAAFVLVGR